MKFSKKLFLLAAILFMLIMAWFVYDVSRKTTFPGPKNKIEVSKDSVNNESDARIKLQEKEESSVR